MRLVINYCHKSWVIYWLRSRNSLLKLWRVLSNASNFVVWVFLFSPTSLFLDISILQTYLSHQWLMCVWKIFFLFDKTVYFVIFVFKYFIWVNRSNRLTLPVILHSYQCAFVNYLEVKFRCCVSCLLLVWLTSMLHSKQGLWYCYYPELDIKYYLALMVIVLKLECKKFSGLGKWGLISMLLLSSH